MVLTLIPEILNSNDIAMDVSEYDSAAAQSAGGKEFCIGKYKETSERMTTSF